MSIALIHVCRSCQESQIRAYNLQQELNNSSLTTEEKINKSEEIQSCFKKMGELFQQLDPLLKKDPAYRTLAGIENSDSDSESEEELSSAFSPALLQVLPAGAFHEVTDLQDGDLDASLAQILLDNPERFFSFFPKLKNLTLTFDLFEKTTPKNKRLTDAHIFALSQFCPLLKELNLFETSEGLTDAALFAICQKWPQLEELSLSSKHLTAISFQTLAFSCKELQKLELSGCEQITPYEVEAFTHLYKLTDLYIEDCPFITEETMQKQATSSQLTLHYGSSTPDDVEMVNRDSEELS